MAEFHNQEVSLDNKMCGKSVDNPAFDGLSSTGNSESKEEPKYRTRNRVSNSTSSWLIFLQNFLFVYASCRPANSERCSLGLLTLGRTWPKGDINLEYGQPLKIYCILNEILKDANLRSRNASDLVFFRNDMLVEQEYITVINETTIMMHMEQLTPSMDMYYCKLRRNDDHRKRHEAVCLNRVRIGSKPKEPRNFRCVSYNWENLVCSWDPVPNHVATKYSLRFNLPGRYGRRLNNACPAPRREYNLPPNTCLWDSSTDPIYRQVYENYTFTLNAENVLGTNSFTYRFHHWAHVIPSKPVDLSVIDKTSSSVLLHWSIPRSMRMFPPGLHHRISYKNQLDSQEIWQTIDITNQEHVFENYFNLTDLQYANTVYNVRVFLKSSVAVDENKWSQFSEVTFNTASALPALPPKTDIGSFEIAGNGGNRDVYIYWQTIPQYLENGDNFTYQVVSVEENGLRLDLQVHEITKTYAMFKGISLNSLKFDIVAANCEGANNNKATVHVPSQLEMPQKPVVFTKIAFDGGIYELSWNSSSNLNIVDYTIFWCESDRDRPYQCSGYLDWVHVPQNTRIYNTTVPDPKKIYQFAIAANTAKGSSGMAWTSSTTTLSNLVGKMNSVWTTRIESDLIEVGWGLEYSGRIGVIENFNINYCPIVSANNLTCDGPEMMKSVRVRPSMLHGVVRDLKPKTTYSITVTFSTKNGEGLHSDALYITTLKTIEDPISKQPRLTDTPPILASVSSDVISSTEIGPRSLLVSKFVENTKQHSAEDGDCNLDQMDELNSDTTDCVGQVNSLTLTISQCMKKINSLSNENEQLRESSFGCNEVLR